MTSHLLKEKEVFIKHYPTLCDTIIDIDRLLPYFVQENIIGTDDLAVINAATPNWISLDGKDVFLDAYNANPTSMIAALEFFIETFGGGDDALFILGDMNELGVRAGELHRRVGGFLARRLVKEAVFIGRHAHEYSKGFGKDAMCYEGIGSFEADWPFYYLKYEKFFIKGSRSLQLESLLDIRE